MSRLNSESPKTAYSERFEPEPTSLRGKSLLHWFGKRIAMGILCSMIATGIYRAADLAKVVRYLCSFVVHVSGDPLTGEGGIIPTIKGEIGDLKGHPRLPGDGKGVPIQLGKTKEQIEADRQKEETKRRQQLDTWRAKAKVVGLEYEEDWSLEQLKVEVEHAEKEAREEDARAAEETKKKPFLLRADKIGLLVDPTADFKTLKHQVEEGEKEVAADAEFGAVHRAWERAMEDYNERIATGPNARCPNPRCRHAMRFNPSRIGTQFICSACNRIFPVRMAMAHWTPPPPPREPQRPKRNPSLWKRIFG
jgi:hypothetical protein